MKTCYRLFSTTLLLTAITMLSMAQPKVNPKAVVDELFKLTQSTMAYAHKLYLSRHYILTDTQIIARPKYTLKVYKYQPVDRLTTIAFSAVNRQINTADYDTYSDGDFKAMLAIIQGMGFEPILDDKPRPGRMLLGKGDYRVIIEQVTTGKLTLHNIAITNVVRTRQFMGNK